VAGLQLLRDGDFLALGFVTHDAPQRLVFVESASAAEALPRQSGVGAVIASPDLARDLPSTLAVAVADSPRLTFYQLHNHLCADTDFYGTTFASEIGDGTVVHPRAFVAETNVRIGADCVVEANASVMEGSVLEDGVIVRTGAIVGTEGFQFERDAEGRLLKVRHAGGVHLGKGVEIQSQSCVDRALFGGFTHLGDETKVDKLALVGHNVRLGKRNLVIAGSVISGSVCAGDDVRFGPGCTITDGVNIGDGATISLGAVVTRDVAAGTRVSGNFAVDHDRLLAHIRAIR